MVGNGAGLRSGQVAEMTGVSPDTIRHYERIGILPHPPRSCGGYRLYSADVIERVHLVRRALQLGFTLAELSEILRVRDKGGIPCRRVLHLAEEKLRSLEHQIAELRQTQTYMKSLVRQWRSKLALTDPSSKALLLHSLIDDGSSLPNTKKKLRRRK
ncbi:MAG: heavy metal-responsive transcriptional regulator [Acidobacteriia bacterium]|nr:heavy metal-responsive transcriptional regulator [Terriglobia bacterium]